MTAATPTDVPVVDVDAHWTEPPELWVDRAPAAFKDRVPRLVPDPDNDRDVWIVDGTVMAGYCFTVIAPGGDKVYGTMTIAGAAEADPSASYAGPRLAMMDRLGVSAQVLFPNAIGFGAVDLLTNVKDGELLNLCASLYNEALADLQAEGGEGASLPPGDSALLGHRGGGGVGRPDPGARTARRCDV